MIATSENSICLNMIVKNEARIITRLFDSVKHVINDYVIIDTGSTDNTVDLIKTYWDNLNIKGKVFTIPFRNFGYNRNEGLKLARNESESDFLLLLDADMVLKDVNFNKNQLARKEALLLKQKDGQIEWGNIRIVRRNSPVSCIGATHEYYDTGTARIEPLDSLFIQDVGDGGSKQNKYERDIKLLEKGIEEEPTNNRYHFYLAQSYRSVNNLDKAIEYYEKHINMPGWDEEIWYSHYSLSDLFLKRGMVDKAEEWAMKGFFFRPKRAENFYLLCKFFRERGDYRKAYSYYLLAKAIPFPKEDNLFVENVVYDGKLDFEYSIINFYVGGLEKRDGLKSCLKVLNSNNLNDREELLTMRNMLFYVESLKDSEKFFSLPVEINGGELDGIKYLPSSPSIIIDDEFKICNIRCVSYSLTNRPMIFHKDKNGFCQTKNLYVNLENNDYRLMEEVILNPQLHEKTEVHIKGLEDVRLFRAENKIKFIAQSAEYKNIGSRSWFNMVVGEYDILNSKLLIENILESPYNEAVEKNWVHLCGDDFIYKWFPIEIGKLSGEHFIKHKEVQTPAFFKHFRGSSNGFFYKNMFWFSVHYVIDDLAPDGLHREYKHCLVLLDENYDLVCFSDPFTFENEIVEFTLGIAIKNNKIIFSYSKNEKDGSIAEIDISYFFNKLNYINKDNPIKDLLEKA